MTDVRDIPVVILAGGLGTRLREETEYRPKPMVKIGHQPILWHIMQGYAHHGFRKFVICLGYKGETIREYFMDYSHNTGDVLLDLGKGTEVHMGNTYEHVDWEVLLADTGATTMTGGRIRRIKDYIKADRFMVTYGDGVSDVDLGALLETHRKSKAVATLTAVRPISRFGELAIESGFVVRFQEKAVLEDSWINGGFFVFERKVFDYLEDDSTVLEQEPLRRLAAERKLGVHHHSGFWQCMDTYREVEMLNHQWESGTAPWKTWSSSKSPKK